MDLFSALRLGRLDLPNRVVMAPMTRSRAIGGVPNDLMRDYYAQRASAGLIVTEGTAPAPEGLGYARIPGLYADDQVKGWRAVTDAVHAAGGRIFAQLMHTGRVAHPANLPAGARMLAPSAIVAKGTMWTDTEGAQPHPAPEAMTLAEAENARDSFARAATNAVAAGFDGVELHAANGYLLEQFLNPHTNRRDDVFGGSVAARSRFVVEAAQRAAEAIGADRVGIRLSPYNTFNDLPVYDAVDETYVGLARALRGLVYLHVVQSANEGFGRTATAMREAFGGTTILNGGFDRAKGDEAIASGRADLVSFGRPFISNPDLPGRLRKGATLAEPRADLFYTPGREGYLDYATV